MGKPPDIKKQAEEIVEKIVESKYGPKNIIEIVAWVLLLIVVVVYAVASFSDAFPAVLGLVLSVIIWEYILRSASDREWEERSKKLLEDAKNEFIEAAPEILLDSGAVTELIDSGYGNKEEIIGACLKPYFANENSTAKDNVINGLLPFFEEEKEWWGNHRLTIAVDQPSDKRAIEAELLDVTYRLTYSAYLDTPELVFCCVSSMREQEELLAKGYHFVLMRGKQVDLNDTLEVESVSLDGELLGLKDPYPDAPVNSKRYALSEGRANKRYDISYTVKTRMRNDKRSYYLLFPHNSMGIEVIFTLGSSVQPIRLATQAFTAGANVEPPVWRPSTSGQAQAHSVVKVPEHRLVLAGGGISYSWDVAAKKEEGSALSVQESPFLSRLLQWRRFLR